MDDEAIEFDERALVQEQVQPLARRQLPFLMLRLEPLFTPAELRFGPPLVQQLELFAHRHGAQSLYLKTRFTTPFLAEDPCDSARPHWPPSRPSLSSPRRRCVRPIRPAASHSASSCQWTPRFS